MSISARRLALIVFAAAGLAVLGTAATSYIMTSRGSGLALGLSGMFLPALLFFVLCPILLLDAGVLALRRRKATYPEFLVLGILVGSVLVVGLLSFVEPFLTDVPSWMLFVIGSSWMAILISAIASLIVIVVATIRAPRWTPAENATTPSGPSTRAADPTP